MSANNQILIHQMGDKFCISDVDVDTGSGFLIGINEGYDTLEEAINVANEYRSENEVEYGIDIVLRK